MSSPTITTQELSLKVSGNQPFVLAEVLPTSYFEAGHLPGAVHMPLDSVTAVARRVAPATSTELIVYCASETCKNSHIAAEKLRALGYENVRVYAGGKADWKSAGLPFEASTPKAVAS